MNLYGYVVILISPYFICISLHFTVAGHFGVMSPRALIDRDSYSDPPCFGGFDHFRSGGQVL